MFLAVKQHLMHANNAILMVRVSAAIPVRAITSAMDSASQIVLYQPSTLVLTTMESAKIASTTAIPVLTRAIAAHATQAFICFKTSLACQLAKHPIDTL